MSDRDEVVAELRIEMAEYVFALFVCLLSSLSLFLLLSFSLSLSYIAASFISFIALLAYTVFWLY